MHIFPLGPVSSVRYYPSEAYLATFKTQYMANNARAMVLLAALPPVLACGWVETQPWKTPLSEKEGGGGWFCK